MKDSMIVFTLFYAIMFGGVLNRLSVWSAFARDNKYEPCASFCMRVTLSYLLLHVLPAIYLALVFWLFCGKKLPTTVGALIGCFVGIFLSVLFIPCCYRLWSAIILRCELHPRRKELTDKIELGWASHCFSALPPFLLMGAGLFLWHFYSNP